MLNHYFIRSLVIIAAGVITSFSDGAKLPDRGRVDVLAWIGPPAKQTTLERYRELADCGFTMSFSSFPDSKSMASALDIAQQAGVKLLVSFPELESDPEGTAKQFKSHPALGGYFLRDEPSAADFDALGKWARRIQAVDPDHLTYVNLFPNIANAQQLGASSYQDYVDRFVNHFPVQVLSFDFYPIVGTSVRPQWYQNLQTIADAARKLHKPFWAFALSVKHWSYPQATLAHLREQVYSDLAYGAQTIEYFTYWVPDDPIFSEAPIDRNGKRTAVYDQVKRMNAEIRALSAVFHGSTVLSLGHTGANLPPGTGAYALVAPVKELKTDGSGAVVSLLANENDRYLVIVNRDISNAMPLQISFDGSRSINRVAKDGTLTELKERAMSQNVEPGDAAILTWTEK